MRDGQFAIFCALLLLVPGLAASDQSSGDVRRNEQYAGYRITGDHMIGVDRFSGGPREEVLLFSDYQSGIVRQLTPVSDTEFTMGPGFDVQSPVQLKVRFIRGVKCAVTSVALQWTKGTVESAKRVALREQAVVFGSDAGVKLAGTLSPPWPSDRSGPSRRSR
jgi:hypothetical protein